MVLHVFGVDDIFVALNLLRSITVCWSIDLTPAGNRRLDASNWAIDNVHALYSAR
jgi:hypothetical protein